MISAFGVEHGISKALHPDEDYYRVHEGRKDRLAFTQQADWSKREHGFAWVNGKKTRDTLGDEAAVRNEYNRRKSSRSAKILGSYKNRKVPTHPHSSMGRGAYMIISEHRAPHTRKRLYAAAGTAAVGATAAAVHHHRNQQKPAA